MVGYEIIVHGQQALTLVERYNRMALLSLN